MIITVREDLTSNVTTEDGLLECELPNYNPETMVPFSSVAEVEAFASTIGSNPNYFIPKLSDEEKQAIKDNRESEAVRAERNKKLVESDWTQVADAPVNKEAWATYRQALRDVTAQETFPWDITWPTKPTE
jgi:hypothetical protein